KKGAHGYYPESFIVSSEMVLARRPNHKASSPWRQALARLSGPVVQGHPSAVESCHQCVQCLGGLLHFTAGPGRMLCQLGILIRDTGNAGDLPRNVLSDMGLLIGRHRHLPAHVMNLYYGPGDAVQSRLGVYHVHDTGLGFPAAL